LQAAEAARWNGSLGSCHEMDDVHREAVVHAGDTVIPAALAMAQRESKFQPGAVSGSRCCYGLFQIYYRWHKNWLPTVGVNSAQELLNPILNAKAAYRMYQRNNGWGPWE
jgi:hypothetical protein